MRMAFAPLSLFSLQLPPLLARKSQQHKTQLLALLALLVAGCTTTPPTGKVTDWNSHRQALSAVTAYQATGKLGYISPAQRFSANLNWKTNPGADHLLLTNFLGTTLLKLDTQPGRAVLIDNEGQRHQGSDAAQLVLSLTNIALPVNQMRDWLLGLPTGADNYQLNAQNRVAYLTKQVGDQRWQLDYNAYDESTSPALPSRLVLSQGKQRVTLIINRWQTQQ
ncbi:lipoprotein insertase outer membrane protein LolB [Photobacterium sp. Hal280]|uniref:lipoprotein insertase outer membrane protein LolB n=1 Tax=Photobacterium sp. Hal280 TaxID=3035163 RepID=UPI00301BFA6D